VNFVNLAVDTQPLGHRANSQSQSGGTAGSKHGPRRRYLRRAPHRRPLSRYPLH
jgi:hypothetical protein